MNCLTFFLSVLSRKDYTSNELKKKGVLKGFDETEIETALEQVQSYGYQSDERLVSNLILASKGQYGKAHLKRKCLLKGIDPALFDKIWQEQASEEFDQELYSLKSKVMRKYKIETFDKLDNKLKAKVYHYLEYRGFNPWEILAQWQQEDINGVI